LRAEARRAKAGEADCEGHSMKRIRFSAALIAALLLSACAARTVRIADLKDRPGHFGDRIVSVHGIVTSSWGIPLAPFQMYNVSDGSGEMTVLARSGRVPPKGTHLKVSGKIQDVASFGSESIGLHLEERDRHID